MPIARASMQGWRLLSPPSPSARPTTNKRKDSKQIRAWGPHNSDAHLARATEGVGGWGRRPVSAREIGVRRLELVLPKARWEAAHTVFCHCDRSFSFAKQNR